MARRINVNQLVEYIFDRPTDALARQLGHWATDCPGFATFAHEYRDKIRKKARVIRNHEQRDDLRFELLIAYWLLQTRHFSVEYESYAASGQRGPDFTVTFRTHTIFNVEVKRLRASQSETSEPDVVDVSRIIRAVGDKLGQMPPSTSNVLVLGLEDEMPLEEPIAGAIQQLLQRAESEDETYFARFGYPGRRTFFKQYLRLSAILLRSVTDSPDNQVHLWLNPQAKHPLPKEIALLLARAP